MDLAYTRRQVIWILLYGVGITGLTSLVWLAGPYIAFGDYRPLETYVGRELAILALFGVAGSLAGFKWQRRKKASKALAEGVQEQVESDEVVLKDKMKDALATLKQSSIGKKDFLYDLPWYLLIGPPGSGKTTALVNSGLKFPLSRGATPAAIAGVGGTRYCDWWFTEDAVLIDTAGRYTTQDSDAKADKQSWLAFLEILKKNRPRQPVNGVIVAISLEDLMILSTADLAAHSNAIRTRLLELHDKLKVDFPVYALFTKGDLVAGFVEYFGFLGENGRKQVWGATFQTSDKTRNMVAEVPVEYDALLERLSEETLDRLQDEPAPNTRVQLFGFPAQMARLKRPIYDFLNQIFEPTRYHANATLRGFYFTSGTQEGTPIDQLIGSLVRSFGAQEVAGSSYSGQGKSYFLHDLILKVIIGEAAWVSTDWATVRRQMILKAAAFTMIGLFAVGATTAWLTSYKRNDTLIVATEDSDKKYLADAGPYAHETLIADRELHKVLPLLQELRYMPAGYAVRDIPTPLTATFGLSQRERLQFSSDNAYRLGLERLFRSRLIFRLEEQLDANLQDPSFVYEALKVYMMMGGLQPPDRELIKSWELRDWEQLYPGATNVDGRKQLEEHLSAMLDLDNGEPLIQLDGRLIEESQKTLARLSVAQRAYALLKSQGRTSPANDWTPARRAGQDANLVFEAKGGQPLDTVRVPEFYTYNGFHNSFIARLPDIAERIKKDRWVLGAAGEQTALASQYDNLPDDLLELYTKDFLAAWRDALGKLELRKLTTDKPKYVALAAISAPTSPLRQVLQSLREETLLTRERPAPKPPAGQQPAKDPATPAAPPAAAILFKSQDRAPGANIEGAFREYHLAIEGEATRTLVDTVVANLYQIAQSLTLLATNPRQAGQATTALQNQVAELRNNAARMPRPFSDMLTQAVGEFEHDVATNTAGQLMVLLRDQVSPVCKQVLGDPPSRYPFVRGGREDVPLADFARIFAPTSGIMDKFFNQYLAPYADTSKQQWTWRQNSGVDPSLDQSALRQFQIASIVRDSFFQGGGNQPNVAIAVRPPSIPTPGVTVKFESGGTQVLSPTAAAPPAPPPPPSPFGRPAAPTPPPPTPSAPPPSVVTIQWPGAAPRTAVIVQNDLNAQPSVLSRDGPWSFFRMLEAGSVQVRGESANATFLSGGLSLTYQFSTQSLRNPIDMSALRQFRCPGAI